MSNLQPSGETAKNQSKNRLADLLNELKEVAPEFVNDIRKMETKLPETAYNPFEFPKQTVGVLNLERSVINKDEGSQVLFVLDFRTKNILAGQATIDGMTIDEIYRTALWCYADELNTKRLKNHKQPGKVVPMLQPASVANS